MQNIQCADKTLPLRFLHSNPVRDVHNYIDQLEELEEFGVEEVRAACPFGIKRVNLSQYLSLEARRPDSIFAMYFALIPL